MSTIKCICIDQALAFEHTPVVASGSLENHISFTFCNLWTGYTKTAVFWRSEADAYHVLLDNTGTCQLPPEVTGDQGTIYFGVFGVNGSKQRTSNVLTYRIEKGAITVATAPSDPTPDIYTQMLAEVAIAKGLVRETRDKEAAFETAVNNRQTTFENAMSSQQTTFESFVNNRQSIFESTMTTRQGNFESSMATDLEGYKNELAEVSAKGLVPDGSITTARLANKSVTAEKLADGVVSGILDKGLKIAVGSYVGKGKMGEANPISLTFDFEPALVAVAVSASIQEGHNIFIRGQTASLFVNVIWSGKTVSWYSSQDVTYMFNDAGKTYYYVAIGQKAAG